MALARSSAAFAATPGRSLRYRDLGTVATIARFRGVAPVDPLRVTGLAAWLLRPVVHLAFLTGFENRLAVIGEVSVPTQKELEAGAPREVKGIYRVEGTFDQSDLLIISWGGTTVEASDNVLVANMGSAGEVVTGQGDQEMRYVIPLNDAAVKKFGSVDRKRLPARVLTPITVDDLDADDQ